jgi:hypothetical protein
MKGTKTKPSSDVEYTITELHIVPDTNEITMAAITDDPEVKPLRAVVDIQEEIDALSDPLLNGINDEFRKYAEKFLGLSPGQVTGDLFSKSSSGA